MFYKHGNGLEPELYAFTDDKLRAEAFQSFRKNLIMIKKDCEKKDFQKMKDRIRQYEIIPHEFKTSADRMGSTKVYQLATEREIHNILLNSDSILLRELNKYTFPIDIFNKDMRESLEKIGFLQAYLYREEYIVYNGDISYNDTFEYAIDELGLFLWINKNTFEK